MKPTGAREKGKAYQRRIAKVLSEWWGEKEEVFRSTPGSGAWDKLLDDGKIIASGDIYCSDSRFPFSVECKCQEGWTLEGILCDKCKQFKKWWKQCKRDATRAGRIPLLVFTRNYQPDLVAFDPLWLHLSLRVDPSLRGNMMRVCVGEDKVVIGELKKFLKLLSSAVVKEVYRNGEKEGRA